jgi:uncharacterized membrane protein
MLVVGMFRNRADAEAAIRDLRNAGFAEEQIGVAMQDQPQQEELAESTGSQVAQGVATGAVSGGILGGLIGLIGSLLIPGLGPVVVGGLLAATLTGVGLGAAAGGLLGALVGMGVPETDVRHFEAELRTGRVLLAISAPSRMTEVLDVFARYGADLGPSGIDRYRMVESRKPYAGNERRYHFDPNYVGLERRLVPV